MTKDADNSKSGDGATGKPDLHPVYSVTNILNKIRMLDGVKVNYSAWVKLFTLHARGYKVLHHIDDTKPPAETDPTYASWCEIDAHVLHWIYGSISDDLLLRILEADSTAHEAWLRLKNHFHNNNNSQHQNYSNLKKISENMYCVFPVLCNLQVDNDAVSALSDIFFAFYIFSLLCQIFGLVTSFIGRFIKDGESSKFCATFSVTCFLAFLISRFFIYFGSDQQLLGLFLFGVTNPLVLALMLFVFLPFATYLLHYSFNRGVFV